MNEKLTVCLTACGRPDLLRITLDSFFKFNTYPVEEFFVYEDSGTDCNKEFEKLYPVTWLNEGERKGQIHALDTLWSNVKTDWAYFVEEDWEHLKPGFIERSFEIMKKHEDVLQVRLWYEEYGRHPFKIVDGVKFLMREPDFWAGTNFNPSLRRKKDYELIAPFSKHTVFNREKPWKSESIISKIYHKLGFRAALIEGYINHIGYDRHVH